MNIKKSNHQIRNNVKPAEKRMHWSPVTIQPKQPAVSADRSIICNKMKTLFYFICALIIIANLWFMLQFVLLVLGTVSDWFRYQGNIDWGASFAFFGRIVLQSLIVTFGGSTVAYLLFKADQ